MIGINGESKLIKKRKKKKKKTAGEIFRVVIYTHCLYCYTEY